MIKRDKLLNKIKQYFKSHRIVCLLGPNGAGKTTLAKLLEKEYPMSHYFDLKKLFDIQALDNPDLILYNLRGLIIIDDIQRRPELFPYLRYLHDENFNQNFLILGDVTDKFIRQSSERLTGRIAYIEIPNFSLNEVKDLEGLWLKGGFPESYLAGKKASLAWREKYILTQVEHNLSVIGIGYDKELLRRLFFAIAGYHGRVLNYLEIAYLLNVTQPTIRKYISYLEGAFMLRLLNPWREDLPKKQVRSPKIFYRDSGIVNYVLNIKKYEEILAYYASRILFENFAMEEIIKFHEVEDYHCYFWASHNNVTLDLLISDGNNKMGFMFDEYDRPRLTRAMGIVMRDLKLDHLTVIYPKGDSYMLSENIRVISLLEYITK